MDDQDLARVAGIVADLKRAGGWDLTGYEDFITDVVCAPAAAPEPDWRREGGLWAKFPDGWAHVGQLLAVSHQHHTDVIDIATVGGPLQFVQGRTTETLSMEVQAMGSMSDLFKLDELSGPVELRVSGNGFMLETRAVITGTTYDQIWAGAPFVVEILCEIVK